MLPPAPSVVVGATVEKRFPGYGIHRGTIAEINDRQVVVHWAATDERTTLSLKEASRRVIAAPVDKEAEEAVPAPAPAPVVEEAAPADERTTLSIKEASRCVIGAPVDEEAEEASSAPALASGGEEPPRLRVGGYAIENSTGRTVRILKHERWRAPSGREHERWHMQPLGRGWIDSRMMHPDLLTPCAPPEAPPPEN